MADDYSDWKLEPAVPGAAPNELAGWTLVPAAKAAVAAPVDEGPTAGDAIGHGLGQGATLGFGDEINGAIQAVGDKVTGRSPGASLRELYKRNRDTFRREDAAAKDAHPWAYGGAELAGSIPTSFVPGLNVGKGAGLAATVGKTALAGGLTGMGTSNADTARGLAIDTGVGTALGGGLGAAGKGLGRLGERFLGKASGIREAVAEKAAEDAAAATASARSAAGTAATDAYKQVENIAERAGGMRQLTPDEAHLAASLEQELADKARARLPESAARKEAKAAEYAEQLATEAARAKAIATEKLSGAEALRQVKARAIRYGLPAVGGAMLGGSHGSLLGAGTGAMVGAGFRPMMHSLKRLAQNPAIAEPVARATGNAINSLVPAATRSAGAAGLELSPELAAQIALLRKKPEPDYSTWTLEGATP